jgi:linoleoyl-CoA desaturase
MPLDSSHRGDRPAAPQPAGVPDDRLKFNGDHAFHRELRRRVDAEFLRSGTSARDSAQMYLKAAVILTTFASAYLALVFFAASWWQGLILGVVLGMAMAAIGFNIMHDGGHHAYSRHRWINRTMALTLDLVGGSSYIWQWKHARFHHTWVNIAGHDSDIDLGLLGRLSPQQPRRPWHRWQHFYLWPLYGITAIRWQLYGDFRDMVTGTVGERPFVRPRGWDMVAFVAGKAVFLTLAFGLPLLFHGLGTVLLFYGLVSGVAGVLLALVFQMAHVVEQAAFPEPDVDGRQIDTPWAIHQLQTTVNFSRDNRLLSWLIGGLNFQAEHHLFPRISHVHYPAVARVVEAACHEYGVPYLVHRSFAAGIASHYRWLRHLGRPLAEPAVPSMAIP